MKIQKAGSETILRLDDNERRLLALALKRASFEDTPPGDQREILEFAYQLLAELDDQR